MNFETRINKLKTKSKQKNIRPTQNKKHEKTVTKSNSLARGYYKFSLTEKRIMELLISKLNPKITNNNLELISLSSKEYSNIFSICAKTAYRDLEKAINNLMHQVITTKKENGNYKQFTLMSSAEYIEGEGRIIASFNPQITPMLQDFKSKFCSYPLERAIGFKSSYTWRMLELIYSWSQQKKETNNILEGWIYIEIYELRKILGVPETYKLDSFKKQVLFKSKQELKDKSNIDLTISFKKTGRKITHTELKFKEL